MIDINLTLACFHGIITRLEVEGNTITQVSPHGHEEHNNRNNLESLKSYRDGGNIFDSN
jgi:hypothetical protein